jgi:translation initiation factor 3 subunit C
MIHLQAYTRARTTNVLIYIRTTLQHLVLVVALMQFSLPVWTVTSIVSKTIWNEELSALLDQSGAVVIFHRIELSRTQQLAQVVAEKVSAMLEQNEKALDLRIGGTGSWTDRVEVKGEKRGEQVQGERRGRNERVRGSSRGGM